MLGTYRQALPAANGKRVAMHHYGKNVVAVGVRTNSDDAGTYRDTYTFASATEATRWLFENGFQFPNDELGGKDSFFYGVSDETAHPMPFSDLEVWDLTIQLVVRKRTQQLALDSRFQPSRVK